MMNTQCYQGQIPEDYRQPIDQNLVHFQPSVNRQTLSSIQTLRERKAVVLDELMDMENQLNSLVGMPDAAGKTAEVFIMEIRSFDEVFLVIQALMERKIIFLNLVYLAPDLAQRVVDFIAGGSYAIDGHQERVGESIFLFTSSSVQISQSVV